MINKDILCAFSGGGFRATFFHTGVLRGLIRLGLKNNIKVISSVSGGSIVNALFGLLFDEVVTVDDFDRLIVSPLVEFSNRNPRNVLVKYRLANLGNTVISSLGAFLGPVGKPLTFFKTRQKSALFIEQLDEYLFRGKTMGEVSPNMRTVINATNLNNGARFRFDNRDFGDYKIGYSYDIGYIPISCAVMASACYPGLFSPMKLDIGHHKFFLRDRLKRDASSPNVVPDTIYLSDGGLFDNLGYYSIKSELECGRDGFVIISDAANHFNNSEEPYGFINSFIRISDILMEQVSNRDRKRIVSNLLEDVWTGVYFKLENSCRSYREFNHHKSADKSAVPDIGWSDNVVSRISQIRTDLDVFTEAEIKCLIFHGETLIETVIAKWQNTHYRQLVTDADYQKTPFVDYEEKKMFEALRSSHKRYIN